MRKISLILIPVLLAMIGQTPSSAGSPFGDDTLNSIDRAKTIGVSVDGPNPALDQDFTDQDRKLARGGVDDPLLRSTVEFVDKSQDGKRLNLFKEILSVFGVRLLGLETEKNTDVIPGKPRFPGFISSGKRGLGYLVAGYPVTVKARIEGRGFVVYEITSHYGGYTLPAKKFTTSNDPKLQHLVNLGLKKRDIEREVLRRYLELDENLTDIIGFEYKSGPTHSIPEYLWNPYLDHKADLSAEKEKLEAINKLIRTEMGDGDKGKAPGQLVKLEIAREAAGREFDRSHDQAVKRYEAWQKLLEGTSHAQYESQEKNLRALEDRLQTARDALAFLERHPPVTQSPGGLRDYQSQLSAARIRFDSLKIQYKDLRRAQDDFILKKTGSTLSWEDVREDLEKFDSSNREDYIANHRKVKRLSAGKILSTDETR